MTKTTKAVAMLGMVAALGVAALPLSSYAVEWSSTESQDGSYGGTGTSAWVKTDTTISLEIQDKLSLESTAPSVTLINSAGSTVTAGLYEHATPVTLTVITKNSKGYKLTIQGAGDTAGDKDATAMYNTAGDKIAAGSFTSANGEASASTWGYGLAANSTTNPAGATIADATKYQAIPAGATEIMSRGTATTDAGDKVDVSFGANVISSQAAGTYTGKVTFTATNQAGN